jgi:hypothetical protein
VKKVALLLILAAACDDGDAELELCEPEDACFCDEGVEREIACVCEGGSTCSISGDSIEFSCDGNAACSLECGTNCLVTCPGTTTCTVSVGDEAVVSCPGTASCDVLCLGDCAVDVAGAASAVVRCETEVDGADCSMSGCEPMSCGDGIYACRTGCP